MNFILVQHVTIFFLFSGLSNLTSLSFKKSTAINAKGMKAFTSLVNLVNLDLERCLGIHGGLIHLKGLLLFFLLWNKFYCNMEHF